MGFIANEYIKFFDSSRTFILPALIKINGCIYQRPKHYKTLSNWFHKVIQKQSSAHNYVKLVPTTSGLKSTKSV